MAIHLRARQTPLVRIGLGKEATFFIVGVVGVATFLRRIRRKKARQPVPFRRAAQRFTQEVQCLETLGEWPDDASAVPPTSVTADQLLLLDEVLPLTPKQVWRLIYDLTFIQAFYQKKGYREIGIGSWQKTGPDVSSKSAHYITPVKKNVIGPREAYTEEEYSCRTRGAGGFIVHVCAYTRQVPYGKSFHIEVTWTASRLSASSTRLQVVGTFVPEKRMLGVGRIIKKAAYEGLEETYQLYRQYLLDNLAGGKGSRGKGPTAKGEGIASRSVSVVGKEAAEDLVRNGVFISWGQLLWALLLLACMVAAARLALDRTAQVRVRQTWRAEWQRASALLFDSR